MKRLLCILKGHQNICQTRYVLAPSLNVVVHYHTCVRCAQVVKFDDEPMDSELMLMLQALHASNADSPASLDATPPKHYIN